MAISAAEDSATVFVGTDTVYIRDLEEHDSETVMLIANADDPVEATHQCLTIGARVVRAAHVSLDADLVEKRFDSMTDHFDEQVGNVVVQIAASTQAFLDEETGALPAVLETHRKRLDELLGAAFDPDSRVSVMAAFEKVMAEAHTLQVENVKRLVTLDGDDSPLIKMQREIVRDVGERLGDVRLELRALSEKIAVNSAIAPVVALSTAKGFAFEDVVHAHVNQIAARHGDVAEQVGDHIGAAGTKKGDELVTLNHEDTHGLDGRFAIEAKTQRLNMRKTLEELDDALLNRDAQAAIAVFSSQDLAPTTVPFQYSDMKAIAVLDNEESDDAALRLAYMWARWVVRRQLAVKSGEVVDLGRIAALIEDARRALERSSAVKSSHTQAKRSIDQAAGHVISLVTEVEQALESLAGELEASGTDA